MIDRQIDEYENVLVLKCLPLMGSNCVVTLCLIIVFSNLPFSLYFIYDVVFQLAIFAYSVTQHLFCAHSLFGLL